MARLAVISDIHGNHVAFERVLVDIERRAVDAVLCLGDIVGYGPDPKECLDLARKACKLIVRGNHENGVLAPETSETWNPLARAGIAHSRACLAAEDLEYIAKLPLSFIISGQILGVHDSPMPSDHGMNYLRTRADAAQAFRWLDVAIALVGHTHVPACFATIADPAAIVAPDDVDAYPVAAALQSHAQPQPGAGSRRQRFVSNATFEIPRFGRVIINPGSVGQPRDGDARASYAILDLAKSTVEFRRVAYDIAAASRRTEAAMLPDISATRLALGA